MPGIPYNTGMKQEQEEIGIDEVCPECGDYKNPGQPACRGCIERDADDDWPGDCEKCGKTKESPDDTLCKYCKEDEESDAEWWDSMTRGCEKSHREREEQF